MPENWKEMNTVSETCTRFACSCRAILHCQPGLLLPALLCPVFIRAVTDAPFPHACRLPLPRRFARHDEQQHHHPPGHVLHTGSLAGSDRGLVGVDRGSSIIAATARLLAFSEGTARALQQRRRRERGRLQLAPDDSHQGATAPPDGRRASQRQAEQ